MTSSGRAARALVCTSLVLGVVGGLAPAASAVTTDVTLVADPLVVRFGGTTTLSGEIVPAVENETVEIVDADTGTVLDSVLTGADGSYEFDLEPSENIRVFARSGGRESPSVRIRVRPVVNTRLGKVLLFGKTKVSGRVRPALAGEEAEIRLRRGRRIVARRTVSVGGDGRVAARFPVKKIGRYRGEIVYNPAALLGGKDRSGAKRPPLPGLAEGSSGKVVRLLERRLRQLRYYLVGINRRFDHRTGDAVLAFHKVQGMSRTKTVSKSTWRRLTKPRRPSPRVRRPRFHIEIDQTKQVLYVIRRGKISEIVHTSTGRNNWTRDGVWRVHRKIAGYSPGRLYYPSYFDGNRAVHGWPSVPTYPASHGCARVPYWTAIHLHNIMGYGIVVRVYH